MIVLVAPVYGNAATLSALLARCAAALAGRDFRLHLVVDASPDDSGAVGRGLAARDPRVRVTVLPRNVGQHAALRAGLAAEPDAEAWVLLDADLQDPPEAVPALLAALPGAAAVFAGRQGAYQSAGRRLTGELHRAVLARLTGLPRGAGAYVVLDARGRAAVLARPDAPSVVVALGVAGVPLRAVAVARDVRPSGRSAWTSRARLRQSARTIAYALRARRGSLAAASPGRPAHDRQKDA